MFKKFHYSFWETICPAVRLDTNDCFWLTCKKTDQQFNPHLTRSLAEIVIRSDNLRYEWLMQARAIFIRTHWFSRLLLRRCYVTDTLGQFYLIICSCSNLINRNKWFVVLVDELLVSSWNKMVKCFFDTLKLFPFPIFNYVLKFV